MKNKKETEVYRIYNSTSEDMSAVESNTVDFVMFAPPYNINTPYDDVPLSDHKSFEEFKEMLSSVIKECFRVLKPGGIFINETADTVYSKGKLIALSGLIQKLCLDAGFSLKERHINFLQSEKGIELTDKEHNWSPDYYSTEDSHSNCHQWQIFEKGKTEFNQGAGKIFYVNYPSDEDGHPCPFSPEHIKIFLDMGSKNGDTVLEPFMGTGGMGAEVLKRGGKYIGFELVEKHYNRALKKLEEATNK